MAELADAPDLGSGIERCAGSIPVRCTNFTLDNHISRVFCFDLKLSILKAFCILLVFAINSKCVILKSNCSHNCSHFLRGTDYKFAPLFLNCYSVVGIIRVSTLNFYIFIL